MDDTDFEPDAQRLAAWRVFLTAHARAVGAIERDLAAGDFIPLTWYDVLVPLSEAPGGRLRLHELADRVVLSRSGLTRLLDRMERADLLRREPC
jgi:DNA-binding MarR family transcriptional regulator